MAVQQVIHVNPSALILPSSSSFTFFLLRDLNVPLHAADITVCCLQSDPYVERMMSSLSVRFRYNKYIQQGINVCHSHTDSGIYS